MTDTTTRTRFSHENCDHPKTKAARAACRRARASNWIDVVRGDELAVKGSLLRVHIASTDTRDADMHEGVLLGWGAKRMTLRVNDQRVNVDVADVLKVEARKTEPEIDVEPDTDSE